MTNVCVTIVIIKYSQLISAFQTFMLDFSSSTTTNPSKITWMWCISGLWMVLNLKFGWLLLLCAAIICVSVFFSHNSDLTTTVVSQSISFSVFLMLKIIPLKKTKIIWLKFFCHYCCHVDLPELSYTQLVKSSIYFYPFSPSKQEWNTL